MMVLQSIEQACRQLGLQFSIRWRHLMLNGFNKPRYDCCWCKSDYHIVPRFRSFELQKFVTTKVFLATYFGLTAETFPGDFGPYWVIDNTPMSDEQTFLPLVLLFQKMRDNGKTKFLHIQASTTNATISTALINVGVFQAWKLYPEIMALVHQWGEWNDEGGESSRSSFGGSTGL